MIIYKDTIQGLDSERLPGFFVGWRCPLTPEQHFQVLKNSYCFVLAWDKDRVVGFINALSDGFQCAFIPMLEVLPEYQGQGIGSALAERMLTLLKNIPNVDLVCDEELQAFYQRFGLVRSHAMILRK